MLLIHINLAKIASFGVSKFDNDQRYLTNFVGKLIRSSTFTDEIMKVVLHKKS